MYLLTSLKVKVKVIFYIAQLRQQNRRKTRKLSIMNKQRQCKRRGDGQVSRGIQLSFFIVASIEKGDISSFHKLTAQLIYTLPGETA